MTLPFSPPGRQRIAVVGSGISGMAAAWYLSSRHEVTLFESAERLGGHTATIDVSLEDRDYAIDTGFIVFNDWTYPHFQRLLDALDVASQPTEMSFSVHETDRDFEYNGHTLASLFAQRRNLPRPSFHGLLGDILRFNRNATRALEEDSLDPAMTLGAWLDAGGYGADFQRRYLLPMGAAIWSASIGDLREFPLLFFVRFFRHHGLLSVTDRPQWYTLVGGSRRYIPALTAPYDDRIRLLPRRRRAWASWNYRLDGRGDDARASVTYDMNILQRLQAQRLPRGWRLDGLARPRRAARPLRRNSRLQCPRPRPGALSPRGLSRPS